MDKVVNEFLQRNLPDFKDSFIIEFESNDKDFFRIISKNRKIFVTANNYISAFHGIYCYLKEFCNVQLSWCGNQKIHIDSLVMFDGEFSKVIEQKYRVYMNYCTLDYSMCWWDFARWAIFYPEAIKILENNSKINLIKGNGYTKSVRSFFDKLDKKIRDFELEWCKTYSEYEIVADSDVIPSVGISIRKWGI